jgi:hypothetical protein
MIMIHQLLQIQITTFYGLLIYVLKMIFRIRYIECKILLPVLKTYWVIERTFCGSYDTYLRRIYNKLYELGTLETREHIT